MERQMCIGLALLVMLGCAKAKDLGKEAFWKFSPVASRGVSVVQVEAMGPYLLAELRGLGPERQVVISLCLSTME